jgi:hypothetical protein
MARPSLEDNIKAGILTINNAATLSGLPPTRIRILVDEGRFEVFKIPGTKNELRIPAAPFLAVVEELGLPISPDLLRAAENYTARYSKKK